MGRVVARSTRLPVLQKYHLDISNIQHYPKLQISAMKVRLLRLTTSAISIRYIKVLQWIMPLGLAEIILLPQAEGLIFKAPKKATLPE